MSPNIRKAWYLAAWTCEVPEDGFLVRKLLDKPRLLFRGANGAWAMLEERCPHRFVPLSRDRMEGGRIAAAT
ncbi:MAG: Rieske 2Fe-2S domain-containing protein [Novosphingobium sp.]